MTGHKSPPDKAALRRRYLRQRESFPPQKVAAASRALCERLARWTTLREAQTILAYLAFRNELDLCPLFERLPGKRWVVPRIEGDRLVLHPYDPARLVRHRFGMLEPAADLPVIEPTALDLILVPGVAFDRQGYRLGFGGGYYDRFLATTSALRVGVTYDECLTDVLLRDDHDQPMDWIVTPTRLFAVEKPEEG